MRKHVVNSVESTLVDDICLGRYYSIEYRRRIRYSSGLQRRLQDRLLFAGQIIPRYDIRLKYTTNLCHVDHHVDLVHMALNDLETLWSRSYAQILHYQLCMVHSTGAMHHYRSDNFLQMRIRIRRWDTCRNYVTVPIGVRSLLVFCSRKTMCCSGVLCWIGI